MSVILAIDTSTGPCSVAIHMLGKVAIYLENPEKTTQSICLIPMIEQALKQAGITYKDVTLLASTVGPGSFTGIRVGLAAARGICFSGNIKGVGFNSLDVLAYGARPSLTLPRERERETSKILSILNAGKGEVYYRRYDLAPFAPLFDTQVGPIEDALASVADVDVIIGNMPSCTVQTPPRADNLALLAAADTSLTTSMVPFYLRAPDAKLPAA